MNANIQGMLNYAKKKSIGNLVQTEKDYKLSHSEAKAYLKWCLNQGYEFINECPEYELIKNEL